MEILLVVRLKAVMPPPYGAYCVCQWLTGLFVMSRNVGLVEPKRDTNKKRPILMAQSWPNFIYFSVAKDVQFEFLKIQILRRSGQH